MYLQQLYKTRKGIFSLVIIVCIIQLIVFWKQGAVLSPFYNYGMYSGKISPVSSYEVYKIYADDHLLRGQDFSSQEWDKIYLPISMYMSADSVNKNMIEVKSRLFKKIGLKGVDQTNSMFVNKPFTEKDFGQWYAKNISAITGSNIRNISIIKYNYRWNGQLLMPVDSSILMHINQ